MPTFAYRAKRGGGELLAGTLQAETRRGALEAIHQMGAFPLEVVQQGSGNGHAPPAAAARAAALPWVGRVGRGDVTLMTRQLADLLKAGVPINRALGTLQRQTTKPAMSRLIGELQKDVSAGRPLHEALGAYERAYPPLYRSMVRAGETGGFLDESLRRIAGFYEREEEIRSRILTALAYPALLLVLGSVSVIVLLVFFIPKFKPIFESFRAELPPTTLLLMKLGAFMEAYWVPVLGGLALAVAGLAAFRRAAYGRVFLDRHKLRVPVYGRIVLSTMVSRFTRTLGALIQSGVPIVEGLRIAQAALGNAACAPAIDEVVAGVRQGRPLSDELRRTGFFPPMAADMVAVGEETGTLDEVLVTLSESLDREVDRRVRVFVSLFEPCLLIVMASIVAFIVVSMLLPVFTLSGAVK
jgi:general secretion pathway protein F/type IV pilus assembly protein PilC